MNKILGIQKKVPQATTLPDGNYLGTWGGYVVEVLYNKEIYELKTEEGVKGMGIRVMVTIKDGEATFDQINN